MAGSTRHRRHLGSGTRRELRLKLGNARTSVWDWLSFVCRSAPGAGAPIGGRVDFRVGSRRLATASFAVLSACSIGSLDTGDHPAPSLGMDDVVSVVPTCVVVPSTGLIGLSKRIVTVQATRDNGHGAESVPVRFRLGACATWVPNIDAGAHGDNADAASALDTSGTCGQASSNDPSYLTNFALTPNDTRRCSSSSTAEVDCVLAPDGSISISVQASLIDSGALGLDDSAPLCVAVRDASGVDAGHDYHSGWVHYNSWRYFDAAIVPSRVGSSEKLAFSVKPSDLRAGCPVQEKQCDMVVRVADVKVGVVGFDVPASNVSENSYETVLRDVKLGLSVGFSSPSPSAEQPYLALSSCAIGESKNGNVAPSIDLKMGQSYATFIVCAAPYLGSELVINASVAEMPNASQVSGMVAFDPPAEIKNIQVDTEMNTIDVTYCGQPSPRAVRSDEIRYVSSNGHSNKISTLGLLLPLNGPDICSALDWSDDGGTDDKCIGNFTLSFLDGHQCALEKMSPPPDTTKKK
jgi:hypothetical protein